MNTPIKRTFGKAFAFVLVCTLIVGRSKSTSPDSDDVPMVEPTAEEVEFVRTAVGERCDGRNCYAYIANQQYVTRDYGKKSPAHLRLLTFKGDDLAFKIYDGEIFKIVDFFQCKPESRCGVQPIGYNNGTFGLFIHDAQRGYHEYNHRIPMTFDLNPDSSRAAR